MKINWLKVEKAIMYVLFGKNALKGYVNDCDKKSAEYVFVSVFPSREAMDLVYYSKKEV